MRIAIDARMINHSGIGTYLKNLLRNYPKSSEFDFVLLGRNELLQEYGFEVVEADNPIYSIKEQIKMPGIIKKTGAELFHCPHYNLPFLYSGKTVVTIHDIIHILFPQYMSVPAGIYSKLLFLNAVKASKHVITDSGNTSKDITANSKTSGDKISVIPLGSNENIQFDYKNIEEIKARYGKFILYIGAIRPHKNVLGLIEAFFAAKRKYNIEHRLILIGKSKKDYSLKIKELIGESADVVILNDVKSSSIFDYYRAAELFVFPSFYEGFGLPVLEAFASGCPVITSKTSSLPEVAGNAAMLINPYDKYELSEAVYKVLSNSQVKETLIKNGFDQVKKFSWKKTADETLQVYRKALE